MSSYFAGIRSCGARTAALGLVPPPPGQRRLSRRVGEFHGFVADLIRTLENEPAAKSTYAHLWDLAGDPMALRLVRLWAFVAEGVAAYAELTAAEAYVGTAGDWTDLRRLAAHVGYNPQARVAAAGWVRVDVDAAAAPLVPAGTRMQAAATRARAAQTFEVAEDTQLYGDWTALTVTVPFESSAHPDAASIRFAQDPGFRAGQRVLFLDGEEDGAKAITLAAVVSSRLDIGTAVVRFDRDLGPAFAGASSPKAYRVREASGSARRLEDVVAVEKASGSTRRLEEFAVEKGSSAYSAHSVSLASLYSRRALGTNRKVVIADALLADASPGSRVAVVTWSAGGGAVVATVERNVPIQWEIAPGTKVRVSQLTFDKAVPEALWDEEQLGLYVVNEGVDACHCRPEDAGGRRVRVYPAPAHPPAWVALESAGADGGLIWSVYRCGADEHPDADGGLALTLDRDPGSARRWRATANLVRVRHGVSTHGPVGSGDASAVFQRVPLGKAPVAHDLDPRGTPVSSLLLRVDGVEWTEVPTLYGAGGTEVYETTLDPDGGETVAFGDGRDGARPGSGTRNVTASYRVGGGRAGEVGEGEITALLGQVRGVKKIAGGPTSGGADQDDEQRLRRLAPARARALGRIVSGEDAIDVALSFPGVSHAALATCGGDVQVVFLRAGATGPKPPDPDETAALDAYVNARRDATFPLRVAAGRIRALSVRATLALDPGFDAATVLSAAAAAVTDPSGPLGPAARRLGQSLDPSDIHAVLHSVAGVAGIARLELDGTACADLAPLPSAADELLVISSAQLQEVQAP